MNIKISIVLMIVGIILLSSGSLLKILHYSFGMINGANTILFGFIVAVCGIAFNYYIHQMKKK